jgi:peptidoglycan/LPS O-acetylase OafA/YrhL
MARRIPREASMRKVLLSLLVLGALLSGACVVMPHDPWEDSFFVFPFFWMFPFGLFGLALYLLPTIIVIARRKKNVLGPILVNVLLGWTFVGWIVALVWACLVEE